MIQQMTPEQMQVPSLYVRVYRGVLIDWGDGNSSLTIREGVSGIHMNSALSGSFPHYT